jgi:hypothetical protein
MPKLLKLNFFWFLYATVLLIIANTMFRTWVIMISVFFGIFFLFRFTRQIDRMALVEQRFYHWAMVIYPLAATAVQWMAMRGWLVQHWTVINRAEHAVWAGFMTILFLPTYSESWHLLKPWQNFLRVVGFVCLLGNCVEFMEFYLRLSPGWIILPERSGMFYTDSILDMMMNLLGGSLGFGMLSWLKAIGQGKYAGDIASDQQS